MNVNESKCILIVEDEIFIALSEKAELEKFGYTILTAQNAKSAISILDSEQVVDLVLMDIDLGHGMDGTECAEQILQHHSLPIVFCSSHTEPEIISKTEKITSYGYVVKSSSPTVFNASIKMAFKLFEANALKTQNQLLLDETGRLARIGGWKIDLVTGTLIWTREVFRIHEVEPDYIPTLENAIDFYDEISKPVIKEAVEKALNEGNAFDLELGLVTAKGNARRVRALGKVEYDASLKVKAVYGSFQDVTEAREKEKILFKNRSMLRMVIDTIPQSVFWKDTNSRYLGCNKVFAKAAGLAEPDDVIGKTDYDLPWPTKDSEAYRTDDREVIDNRKAKFHIIEPLLQADGSKLLIDTSKIPLFDPDGKVFAILGVYEDVTAQKQLEETLSRIKMCVDTAADCLFWINADGKILDANKSACRVLGYSYNEILDLNVGDLDVDFPFTQWPAHFEKLRKAGMLKFLSHHKTKTGGIFPVEIVANYLNFDGMEYNCAFVRDISERVLAESKQKEHDELYRLLFEKVSDAIFIFDPETFRIIEANQATCEMYGYAMEELIGLSCLEFSAEVAESQKAADKMRMRAVAEVPVRHHKTKNGNDLYVHLTMYKIRQYDKDVVFSVCTNITDLKLAEQTIADQLEEKEILLKEVHHRIKNNILSVETLLTLQLDSKRDSEAASVLQDAIVKLQSIRTVYEKLLHTTEYKSISAKNYFTSLFDSIKAVFPEHSNLNYELEIEEVYLDVRIIFALGLIVNELMTNSTKYAFTAKRNGNMVFELKKSGERIFITFRDDGSGLPDGFNLDESTGFGLTLIRMLVKQLRGNLQYCNEFGACFMLDIPMN